jgi:hypothetical protein
MGLGVQVLQDSAGTARFSRQGRVSSRGSGGELPVCTAVAGSFCKPCSTKASACAETGKVLQVRCVSPGTAAPFLKYQSCGTPASDSSGSGSDVGGVLAFEFVMAMLLAWAWLEIVRGKRKHESNFSKRKREAKEGDSQVSPRPSLKDGEGDTLLSSPSVGGGGGASSGGAGGGSGVGGGSSAGGAGGVAVVGGSGSGSGSGGSGFGLRERSSGSGADQQARSPPLAADGSGTTPRGSRSASMEMGMMPPMFLTRSASTGTMPPALVPKTERSASSGKLLLPAPLLRGKSTGSDTAPQELDRII